MGAARSQALDRFRKCRWAVVPSRLLHRVGQAKGGRVTLADKGRLHFHSMKTYPFINLGLTMFLSAMTFGTSSLLAQDQVPVSSVETEDAVGITADKLEDLVGPIALYPDALIALILPAATVSSDVVLAARFLKSGNTITAIDSQPWEDSVKGLAHYPDVVKWMDENLEWTQQMGEAYLAQPQAVMDAIQRARAIARSNGVLVDTPQQRVVIEDTYIRIIPAQRDVIYVPRYDPEIIYVQRPLHYYPDPWVTFGIGFGVGSWLSYDLDWRSHRIWVDHHRHHHWRQHHDWRHRPSPGRPGYVHNDHHWRPWAPLPHRPRPPQRDWRDRRNEFARPAPLPGAPRFDRERWKGRERDDRIVGGRRPGVVLPDHQRDRGAQTNTDRRDRWRNRERREDDDNQSNRPRPGGFRRPGTRSEVTTNVMPSPQTQAAPSAQVAPAAPSARVEQPGIVQGRQLNRVGRPPADGRFGARRSMDQASSPNDRRWQRQQGAQAPSVSGQGERRRGPNERTNDRQFRQPSAPSVSQSPVVTARQAPMSTPSVPQVRSAPPREFRQPARIAQPSAPASAPAAVRQAPAVRSEVRAEARAEARASRGDHGARSADNHVNRNSGRGSRDRRSD